MLRLRLIAVFMILVSMFQISAPVSAAAEPERVAAETKQATTEVSVREIEPVIATVVLTVSVNYNGEAIVLIAYTRPVAHVWWRTGNNYLETAWAPIPDESGRWVTSYSSNSCDQAVLVYVEDQDWEVASAIGVTKFTNYAYNSRAIWFLFDIPCPGAEAQGAHIVMEDLATNYVLTATWPVFLGINTQGGFFSHNQPLNEVVSGTTRFKTVSGRWVFNTIITNTDQCVGGAGIFFKSDGSMIMFNNTAYTLCVDDSSGCQSATHGEGVPVYSNYIELKSDIFTCLVAERRLAWQIFLPFIKR